MNSRAGITRMPRWAGRGFGFGLDFGFGPRFGFSLVELLLAVALLGLLLGAVAFNFSTLQRGARLDEGADQLEALLRFARAQAAATGHRVRISFDEDVGEGLLVPVGNLAVTWEPDPLAEPDRFQSLPEAAPYLNSILDVISIEDVQPGDRAASSALSSTSTSSSMPSTASVPPAGDASLPGAGTGLDALDALDGNAAFGFAPITFFPDGSSDSAEITIAPRDDQGEDARRIIIRLSGLTGAIRRRVVGVESVNGEPPATPPAGPDDGHGPPGEGTP